MSCNDPPTMLMSTMSRCDAAIMDQNGLPYSLQEKNKQRRRISFSNIHIIEFPYAIGNTPCNNGVPIGASHMAQYQVSFQIDHFESSRPPRRSKTELHISAANRKSILLRSGYSADDISEATKAAAAVRKERAETMRELRAMLQASTEKSQTGCNSQQSSSPKADSWPQGNSRLVVCPSPVPPSPLRPSHRRNGITTTTSRAEDVLQQRRRRRRLSLTKSPMPLKVQTQSRNLSPQKPPLSPLRTKTKMPRTPIALPANLFGASSPTINATTEFSLAAASPTPKGRAVDGQSFFCESPSVGRRSYNEKENHRGGRSSSTFAAAILPPTRPPSLTPVKRGRSRTSDGIDRPLVMPRRCATPPPPSKSPICAARMY